MEQRAGMAEKTTEYIRKFYIENMRFPTYQEIGEGMDRAKSTVFKHMNELEKREMIVRFGNQYIFKKGWMIGMYCEILMKEGLVFTDSKIQNIYREVKDGK